MANATRAIALSACALACAGVLRAEVILQYFEAEWTTIERRLPDLFMAGYKGIWLPPPGRADSGDQSVGYDVFDRFDLGNSTSPTLYGTEQGFRSLVRELHYADQYVYVDLILNHNGFRDHNTPGFETGGGYPGFAVTLPGDPYGDFHQPPGSDRYTERVAGLIDIAQEKNHSFIRHPAWADPNNLPHKPIDPAHRALYPDRDLPPNGQGVYPFNSASPLAGDPVPENATGVLLRNTQWLVDVIGVDGFRIDAQKHIPEWFFDSFYDSTLFERGRPNAAGLPTTPFSFGEVYDGSYSLLAGYIRKVGFGNRDVLDYPLYFAFEAMLNANGFGSWVTVLNTSVDFSDGNGFDGSRGVLFVNNHDRPLQTDNLLGYAYILTRPGYPIVYHNAHEFGARPFPNDGRADALGGPAGDEITRLVDIHNEYGRGAFQQRFVNGDIAIYERQNALLVGLQDNADTSTTSFDARTVVTSFTPGSVLHELTGNAADPLVDPGGNVPETLIVSGDGTVNLRVPRNIDRRGYVAYGPPNPDGALSVGPTAGTLPADGPEVPALRRRHTPVPIITAPAFAIQLQTADADPLDVDGEDDQALFKVDAGGDFNGSGGIDHTSGEFAGFEEFVSTHSPLFGGGTGLYVQTIDTSLLDEGLHAIEVSAFRRRTAGPPITETWRQPVYVDRVGPVIALTAPTTTGSVDVNASSTFVRVQRADRTADRVHVIFDRSVTTNVLPLVNTTNQMARLDTDEFVFQWNGVTSGNHTIAVVAFEPSGNVSVTRYAGIHAIVNGRPGPGDLNNDGSVDFFDIDAFVAQVFNGIFSPQADCNGDGLVDFFDIDAFLAVLFDG
jgi:glycosidase